MSEISPSPEAPEKDLLSILPKINSVDDLKALRDNQDIHSDVRLEICEFGPFRGSTDMMICARIICANSTIYFIYPQDKPNAEIKVIKEMKVSSHGYSETDDVTHQRFYLERQFMYRRRGNPYWIRTIDSPAQESREDADCYGMDCAGSGMHLDDLIMSTAFATLRKDPQFVAAILVQILAGLVPVHMEGSVLRDLYSPNVLIDKLTSGQPFIKLSDPGFYTNPNRASQKLTPEGAFAGSPATFDPRYYTKPPDEWSGHYLSDTTDLYAVGCIAYKIITGQEVFPITNPKPTAVGKMMRLIADKIASDKTKDLRLQIFESHVHKQPDLAKLGDIDNRLYALIESLLQKDPDQRCSLKDAIAICLSIVRGSPYEDYIGPIKHYPT